METEIEVTNSAVLATISVLENEINSRIRHGDGDIDELRAMVDALGEADRIVIR